MPLGYLASLVASMPGWITLMIERDELDIGSDPAGNDFRPTVANSSEELIAMLDKAVADARRSLGSTTEEHLLTPWAFKMGGHVVSQDLRYKMIANAVFSHLAHHRGQLSVYLRLNDASVPAMYGPSADEQF
jgi:uncharacterized damage-inducible protein DinB